MDSLRGTGTLPRALSAEEARVKTPAFTLLYEGRNITADVTPFFTTINYADYIEGESDSIDVTLEDVDGKWISSWYPNHADRLRLAIGYEGETLLPCGEFEIDEITCQGPPDTVTIKALAAGVKRSYRSNKGRAFENTTLKGIAEQIAKRVHLTVTGNIEAIPIRRVTQLYERDLAFLQRVAAEYGYAFNVRGRQMVFFKSAELKAAAAVLEIPRAAVSRWNLRDKVKMVYGLATVSYHDPNSKRLLKRKVVDGTALSSQNAKANEPNRRASADELNLNVRAEDDAQADAKARAALERANEDQTAVELTLFGEPRLAAGLNVNLTGFGHFSGIYSIARSRHQLARGAGYTTEIECKRVRA